MDTTTTRDTTPIRLAGGRRRRPAPEPEPEPPADAAAAEPLDGVMPTTEELLELLGASEPPDPPDWWREAWYRRQRRLRVRIQQYLREGPQTTTQIGQRCGDFERAELEHALADLGAAGVIAADLRDAPVRAGAAGVRTWLWWRLPTEVG